MQRTLLWKIALIGLVALLLQIPVGMVRGLILERKQARDGVIADIARRSSEAQKIVGPVLYVPWTRRSTEAVTTTDDGGRSRTTSREKIERGQVALLPASLSVDGKIDLQEKHRGIRDRIQIDWAARRRRSIRAAWKPSARPTASTPISVPSPRPKRPSPASSGSRFPFSAPNDSTSFP